MARLGRLWRRVSAGHYANFSELRQHEVRRIPLPRTPVNKGKKKGRGMEAVALN
jgi:hypothetical protein